MKIAHLGDNHFCTKHLEWVSKAHTAAIDYGIAAGVEAWILAGDLFDAAIAAHDPAYHAALQAIIEMAQHAPVLVIAGTASHDRPGVLEGIKYLHARHPIAVCERAEQVALYAGAGWVHYDGGDLAGASLLVSALPGMNPAELKAKDDAPSRSAHIDALLEAWKPHVLKARAAGVPTVLTLHGEVNGCRTEGGSAMVSQDWQFAPGQLLASEHSAIMAAHIHRHQAWEHEGRRLAYCGSTTKLVYGFEGQCGMLVWDVQPRHAGFTLYETPSRQLVELEFDGPPDMAALRERLRTLRDAWVRLRWSVDEEHRSSVDVPAIREMLTAAGVADYKLEPRINPLVRSRAAGIHMAATLEQKLATWAELNVIPASPLLQRLALLRAGQQPGAST